MKNIFKITAMLLAALTIGSCGDKPSAEPGGDDPVPPSSDYYEFPLDTQDEGFTAGNDGVSINVSEIEEDNIVFTLVPGKAISSYRMAVYPKSMLYNLLLNEGKVNGTQEECEEVIIELLTSFNPFNEKDDEFEAKEFDWANSEYSLGPVLPDCEYFIIVEGCYDDAGMNPASLSIAYIETPSKELSGAPQIGIEVDTGYTAFIVRYHPGEDCRYFYHWIGSTKEIDEYIDLFGERLMRDFCRSAASEAMDASLEQNLIFKTSFAASENAETANTAIAVPLDINQTPSESIIRYDFDLKDIPEGNFTPVARIEAGSRLGATIAYFHVEMEKNCMSCFYRIYKAEEADIIRGYSDEEKAALAVNLAAEGWGVANPRFSFDPDLEILTGDAFSSDNEHDAELKPDTEYVIAYVGKNYFQQLSELKFSEPFRTKPLIKDNPDLCESDLELTFSDVTRWSFKYNFNYTYSKTASYRFQLVWPYDENAELIPPHYINDRDDREKWMTFFYDTYVKSPAGFETPIANIWVAEPSGYDGYDLPGYESDITYVFAYCAEDLNGVVGPVKFVEVTTKKANPGPNPTIEIEGLDYDEESGEIKGKFVANEDTKVIKYFSVSSNDDALFASCAINDLVRNNRRSYEEYLALWESQLIELGLSSNAESFSFSFDADKNSDIPVLVAGIAIGEDDGEDVYSPIACKLYHKGEFKDLSDFRSPSE